MKKIFCFTGLSRTQNFSIYHTNLTTMKRAVLERVLLVKQTDGTWSEPYRPKYDQFNPLTGSFVKRFKKLATFSLPMTAQAFAESYQAPKKTVYLKAVADNLKLGFSNACARVATFLKVEKYNFTKKKDPVPRVIQPRDPRYIVETGRYIKPIEKKLYKNIDTIFGSPTVFKCYNASTRGALLAQKWYRFSDPVAIGLDASKFDKHVSNAALCWEHQMYMFFYPGDGYLKRLLGLQRENICCGHTADGTVRYKTKHNRMSGDSNTSCGNVLIMCGLLFGYKERHNVDFELVNDGDDCVLILERRDLCKLDDLRKWFNDAGFVIVLEETVDVIEQIEFCQCRPVLDNTGQYIMVRDPRVSLAKDAVAIKPLDNRRVKEMWMSAVGKGGLTLCSGIPVLQSYYNMYVRHSNGAKPLKDKTLQGGLFYLSRGMDRRAERITPESRASFWAAFGATPSEQIAMESYYDNLHLTTGSVENRFNDLLCV